MSNFIEGAISVKACIINKKRDIEAIYIDKNKTTKDFNYIRKIAVDNNIDLIEMTRDKLDGIASGKSYGGIICKAQNRKSDNLELKDIFYIDGIEDPYNLGYCIRTLYAFGFQNIILPFYNYQEAQLIKSSAGAFEMANIMFSKDVESDIRNLKNNEYTVYSLKRGEKSKDIFITSFNKKSLFMIGGEKRGIKSSLNSLVDCELYIPYGSDFRNSLSATSSIDVLATLLYKQRKYD